MVRELVPSMSDMSVECQSGNGGTWSVTRNTHSGTKRAILTSRLDVRANPFYHGERIASFHVRYECWPFCRVGQM